MFLTLCKQGKNLHESATVIYFKKLPGIHKMLSKPAVEKQIIIIDYFAWLKDEVVLGTKSQIVRESSGLLIYTILDLLVSIDMTATS